MRDIGLVSSATTVRHASSESKYLHADLCERVAAVIYAAFLSNRFTVQLRMRFNVRSRLAASNTNG